MFKIYLLICITGMGFICSAQDKTVSDLKDNASRTIKKDPADTTAKMWKKGGLFNVNFAQGSLTNWAAGGDDFSLSLNAFANLYAFYKKDRHSWDNTLDLNFGLIKTTSLGSRKNDDRIDLLSKYGYQISPHLSLTGLFNFRTQFFKGYTYTDTSRILSSDFLSPAYVLVSAGIDYKPITNLSIFLSPLTQRWTIVHNEALAAKGLYGVPPGKKSYSEFGAYATINYLNTVSKSVSYKGRLDLFSNYSHEPENVDVYMTNLFAFKVSRILSATWNIDLIYDDDIKLFGKNHTSAALQVKSLIGIGLLVKI